MKDPETIQWRSWNAKVFQEARDLGKPIFLSISAAWCHWCHVMDEESFTHPEVIRRLNADFIPVRVDSDKRPDINSRYNMGGWPTVAVLDTDGKVMAGGTYLPLGQFLSMLSSINRGTEEARQESQEAIAEKDSRVTPKQPQGAVSTAELDESLVEAVGGFLQRAFDSDFGGFGGPPKFPQPWAIELAFHLGSSTGDKKWSEMATVTLDNMREGGIYDPVDGGFFRYATRGDWDNPHYEKLLDTNARMLSLYLKAYRLTGQTAYLATARGILDYFFLTLTSPDQVWFYGSQSADHDYYSLEEEDRMQAEQPPLDRAIYTDSNATAASALLSAGHILGDLKYQAAAIKLIDFLWTGFHQSGQGMFHYNDAGGPSLLGHLSDQVQMMTALLDAFEATGSKLFLSRAKELVQTMEHHLWDADKGGYWDLPLDSESFGALKIRVKPFVENASASMALNRLYHLTGQEVYRKGAEAILRHLSTVFMAYKHHASPFAVAVECFLKPPCHITIVGKREDAGWKELLFAAHKIKALWKVVLPLDHEEDGERLTSLGYPEPDRPLAYLCKGKVCLPPVSKPEDIAPTAGRFKA